MSLPHCVSLCMILYRHAVILLAILWGALSAIAQPKDPGRHRLLWRISRPGVPHTSYVFGSIHLPFERVFRFGDSVLPALQRCSIVATEVDFGSDELLDRSMDVADAMMKDPNMKRLAEFAKEIASGSRDGLFGKPYSDVVDMYLYRTALGYGKVTTGLENIDSLIHLLRGAGLSSNDEVNTDEYLSATEDLVAAYEQGDMKRMHVLMNLGMSKRQYKDLIVRRNRWMTDSIDVLARESSLFATVGAGHLTGSEGIPALLKAKGWTVTPVRQTFTTMPPREVPAHASSEETWTSFANADSTVSFSLPGKPMPLPKNSPETNAPEFFATVDAVRGVQSVAMIALIGNNTDKLVEVMQTRLGGAVVDSTWNEEIDEKHVSFVSTARNSGLICFVSKNNRTILLCIMPGLRYALMRRMIELVEIR